MVCRTIGVSRSGYYRQRKTKTDSKKELEAAIINCFKKHNRNYGRIRIRKELLQKGIKTSEYFVAKVLKGNELQAKSGRDGKHKHRKTTETQYIEENLVTDKFSVVTVNMLWCSDISELKCKVCKIYVCAIIDVATRRIVGWAIKRMQNQKLVQAAFYMAAARNQGKIPERAIYHSDRGSQFTAKSTKELVEKYGFQKSMSRPGRPDDNQPIESFWHTLEIELPDISKLNYEEARRTIINYIEIYYNSERLHSGIGYRTPNDYLTLLCVHES